MAVNAISSNSLILSRHSLAHHHPSTGFRVKPSSSDMCSASVLPPATTTLSLSKGKLQLTASKRPLAVRAAYSDGGRPSPADVFVGGFVLGALTVGALGCVFAPQLSKALVTDRKELMRKLPKFIYDEEKEMEKTQKILTAKIDELNAALDDISAQIQKNPITME
ncbi:hypothetical protein Tsubulata_048551 [Turnera subulata]|uniref:Uncharacterized protein n=1 Tax=Turnera subulata TaxID=218843 RepID=A0A9Q0FQ88_9ROSI|nr:hypothetical protein Tsubulata_048551 [Turnera subulata]